MDEPTLDTFRNVSRATPQLADWGTDKTFKKYHPEFLAAYYYLDDALAFYNPPKRPTPVAKLACAIGEFWGIPVSIEPVVAALSLYQIRLAGKGEKIGVFFRRRDVLKTGGHPNRLYHGQQFEAGHDPFAKG
jgi:hypothetical protein